MSEPTRWSVPRRMRSACASVQTALPNTCARPGNTAWRRESSNQVNWLSILTSRRIWTSGLGTIAPLLVTATWGTSVKTHLLLAATAACLALASTSSAQDDNPAEGRNSLKQDARDMGATVKRDAKEAAAVIKRDTKEAGQAIARGAKATGAAVKRETKAAGVAIKKGAKEVGTAVKQ